MVSQLFFIFYFYFLFYLASKNLGGKRVYIESKVSVLITVDRQ